MPSASPTISAAQIELLAHLGKRLRAARKQQKVSATSAAQAAGMSRVTWHRIERGESSVTIGAWVTAADALGLKLDWLGTKSGPLLSLGNKVRLADYPQLQRLAWQLPGVDELTPLEALSLYERNWRHVDRAALTMAEIALIHALATTIGSGKPLV